VSGDASGEAALEELLGRIAARWAGLDIPLVPHQGAKDTWVLGALDELTAALEVPPRSAWCRRLMPPVRQTDGADACARLRRTRSCRCRPSCPRGADGLPGYSGLRGACLCCPPGGGACLHRPGSGRTRSLELWQC